MSNSCISWPTLLPFEEQKLEWPFEEHKHNRVEIFLSLWTYLGFRENTWIIMPNRIHIFRDNPGPGEINRRISFFDYTTNE